MNACENEVVKDSSIYDLNRSFWLYISKIREKISNSNTLNEASKTKTPEGETASISSSFHSVIQKTTSMSLAEKEARPRCEQCKSLKCDGTWETYSKNLPDNIGKNERSRRREQFIEKHK